MMLVAPMATVPTLSMPHGKAWCGGPRNGLVDTWMIEAPWAHPAWHSYAIELMALDADSIMYLAHATHELHVWAIEPVGDRDRLVAEWSGAWCKFLAPLNFAAQFVEVTNDLARARVRHAVELICAGDLSPDTDYVHQWVALFGNNMIK